MVTPSQLTVLITAIGTPSQFILHAFEKGVLKIPNCLNHHWLELIEVNIHNLNVFQTSYNKPAFIKLFTPSSIFCSSLNNHFNLFSLIFTTLFSFFYILASVFFLLCVFTHSIHISFSVPSFLSLPLSLFLPFYHSLFLYTFLSITTSFSIPSFLPLSLIFSSASASLISFCVKNWDKEMLYLFGG